MLQSVRLGICVKDTELRVLEQNAACIRLCGDRRRTICAEGCMKGYLSAGGPVPFDQGIRLTKSATPKKAELCETAVINDGERIVTILFPLKLRASKELEALGGRGLSKREMEIMSLVTRGLSASEIRGQLFISKSTLRTHLNNIYKKLPEELRRSLRKRRSSQK